MPGKNHFSRRIGSYLTVTFSPRRFFAANELKAMFAHTVMHYDIKLENEGHRPENFRFANIILPDPNAQVLFRKRQD